MRKFLARLFSWVDPNPAPWVCCECGAVHLDHAPTCPYR